MIVVTMDNTFHNLLYGEILRLRSRTIQNLLSDIKYNLICLFGFMAV